MTNFIQNLLNEYAENHANVDDIKHIILPAGIYSALATNSAEELRKVNPSAFEGIKDIKLYEIAGRKIYRSRRAKKIGMYTDIDFHSHVQNLIEMAGI